jgi:N-acetylglucosaminyldiphosphoundecaprenol N-acetyl-beta-D-mannosaminyltransferase
MKINILGSLISKISKVELLSEIKIFLNDGRQHFLVTPNPEIVLAAMKDKKLQEIINKADIAIPDGFGLILASKYLKRPLKERVTGVDLMSDICKIAEEEKKSIFLFGGEEEIVGETAKALMEKFANLKIAGALGGKKIDENNLVDDNILEKINQTKPDIIFVALGGGKQEKWIDANLKNLPSIKLAMGIGGAFDFISGKIRRAPRTMRKLGLEWLFRLFIEPRRIRRIFNATIRFSYKVITNK